MARRVKDHAGLRYGRLTVIERDGSFSNGDAKWLCQCSCGGSKRVRASHLNNGHVRSCGCLRIEVSRESSKTHGKSKTRLYSVWQSIIRRCKYPKDKAYHNYGARGIDVCEEWRNDFSNFYDWCQASGYEHGLWIDRIDNDGDYEPSNCRWVNAKESNRNRRMCIMLTCGTKTACMNEWAEYIGITKMMFKTRLKTWGWSLRKIISEHKPEVLQELESGV